MSERPTPDDVPTSDRLEQAMNAMRTTAIPEIPTTLMSNTRRVVRQTQRRPIVMRLAIAASVAALLGGGVYFALRPATALAFADVIERVEAAKTVKATLHDDDVGVLTIYARGTFVRVEQARTIMISDLKSGEMLSLEPEQHRAVHMVMRRAPVIDVVDFLRNIGSNATTPIGQQKIGDIDASGFEGSVAGELVGEPTPQRVRVWVDPATKFPIRVEMVDHDDATKVEGMFDAMTFDEPLDDALFDLKPPAGYTVTEGGGVLAENLKPPATTQEAAALVLRPLVGVGGVRFGMTREEAEAILGKPDLVGPNGLTNEYYSRGLGLLIDKRAGVVGITAYSHEYLQLTNVHDFPGKTDKGIGMGASRAEIVTAYGEPSNADARGEIETLRYDAFNAAFTLNNGKLVFIFMNRPRVR